MSAKIVDLAVVFLLTAEHAPAHANLEFVQDMANFVQKPLAEIIAHLAKDPERNAAIFEIDGLQGAVVRRNNEHVVAVDLEYDAEEFDGIDEGWSIQQALSALHNPEGPFPIEYVVPG